MCVLMQCKNAPITTPGQAIFGLMRQSQESKRFRYNAESGNLAQGIANVSNTFYSEVPMIPDTCNTFYSEVNVIPDMSVFHSLAQAT